MLIRSNRPFSAAGFLADSSADSETLVMAIDSESAYEELLRAETWATTYFFRRRLPFVFRPCG